MNDAKRLFILFGLVALCVCATAGVLALQGLSGNPSSASVLDLRPIEETIRPAVGSGTRGMTWQIARKINFSDTPTTQSYYAEIGTIPADMMMRNVYYKISRAEAFGTSGSTCVVDTYFANSRVAASVDIKTTGTVCVDVPTTGSATRGNTMISIRPSQTCNDGILSVWVMGEMLVPLP